MGEVTPLQRVPEPLITAPAPLDDSHDVSRFDCGKEPLNDWIRQRAIKSEGRSARCFVTCQNKMVIGYYCTAAGAVEREKLPKLPKNYQRNMPESVPVVIIGRLAVDRGYQGRGIGAALLKDAFSRILNASREVGARAILVHAIDGEVVPFYAAYGFLAFPTDARTLFLPLETIAGGL